MLVITILIRYNFQSIINCKWNENSLFVSWFGWVAQQ